MFFRSCRDVRGRHTARLIQYLHPRFQACSLDRCPPDRTGQQMVEAAEFGELAAIECARSAAPVKARIRAADSIVDRCRTRNPPCAHHACVKPVSSRSLFGSLKKSDRNGENTSSEKPSSNGARKFSSTAFTVEQHYNVVLRCCKTVFDPPPNPRFAGRASIAQWENCREETPRCRQWTVIDNDDFVFGRCGHGANDRWQELPKQLLAIPLGITTLAHVWNGRCPRGEFSCQAADGRNRQARWRARRMTNRNGERISSEPRAQADEEVHLRLSQLRSKGPEQPSRNHLEPCAK